MHNRFKLILAISLVLGIPTGYAIAQETDETPPPGIDASPVPVPESEVSTDESNEVDFAVDGAPSEDRLQECETGDSSLSALHCDALSKIDSGELPPGEYSDKELRKETEE